MAVTTRRRSVAAGLLAGAACWAGSACSASSPRDCGYSVRWHETVYWYTSYVLKQQHLQEKDLRAPVRGPGIGHADTLACPGDRGATGSVAVFEIQRVAPGTAIMTRSIPLIAQGERVPDVLINRVVTRSP